MTRNYIKILDKENVKEKNEIIIAFFHKSKF